MNAFIQFFFLMNKEIQLLFQSPTISFMDAAEILRSLLLDWPSGKRLEDHCEGFPVLRMCFLGWLRGQRCLIDFFAYRNRQHLKTAITFEIYNFWEDLRLKMWLLIPPSLICERWADVVKYFIAGALCSAMCSGLASVIWGQIKLI